MNQDSQFYQNNNQYVPPVPPYRQESNGMAVAGLVCGILGIIASWIPVVCFFTLIISVLGIIFGASGVKKARFTGTGNGMAVAGLVCGIIGTVFGFTTTICTIIAIGISGKETAMILMMVFSVI